MWFATGFSSGIFLILLFAGIYFINADVILRVSDPPRPADAILVLGGGSEYRVLKAIELFESGYADTVIFSGGLARMPGGALESSAIGAQRLAVKYGLPDSCTVIADSSTSTIDEAERLVPFFRGKNWQTVILVTTHTHSRRAKNTFEKFGKGFEFIFVPCDHPEYDLKTWWQSEKGLMAVFSETVKMPYYWLRYGISPI